jgi:hypothetical protein
MGARQSGMRIRRPVRVVARFTDEYAGRRICVLIEVASCALFGLRMCSGT